MGGRVEDAAMKTEGSKGFIIESVFMNPIVGRRERDGVGMSEGLAVFRAERLLVLGVVGGLGRVRLCMAVSRASTRVL